MLLVNSCQATGAGGGVPWRKGQEQSSLESCDTFSQDAFIWYILPASASKEGVGQHGNVAIGCDLFMIQHAVWEDRDVPVPASTHSWDSLSWHRCYSSGESPFRSAGQLYGLILTPEQCSLGEVRPGTCPWQSCMCVLLFIPQGRRGKERKTKHPPKQTKASATPAEAGQPGCVFILFSWRFLIKSHLCFFHVDCSSISSLPLNRQLVMLSQTCWPLKQSWLWRAWRSNSGMPSTWTFPTGCSRFRWVTPGWLRLLQPLGALLGAALACIHLDKLCFKAKPAH